MTLILAAWLLASIVVVGLWNLTKSIVRSLYRYDEIAGCPDPDICPGCDGYLEFDDDGSNICPVCGSTWWWCE